ncbi:hypothetical protein POP15_096 [Pectobacterium phage POP15]|nr:hypothetical protein POP15_096 [Pectobacterium phage POP15]
MSNIKAGDVVRLKSGGQLMAVRRLDKSFSYTSEGEEVAVCQWFHEGELKTKSIAVAILEKHQ